MQISLVTLDPSTTYHSPLVPRVGVPGPLVPPGGAADLGLVYDLNPQLHLGAAARNLGGMSTLDRESTALPREIRLGLSYTGRDDLLVAVATTISRTAAASVRAPCRKRQLRP